MTKEEIMSSATERSAVYRILSENFAYPANEAGMFGIRGAEYCDAFDPSVNPNACSIRESAYANEEHSALFEELVRFYEFFGLKRTDEAELPDHIAVELEFMHLLTHLEEQVSDQADSVASLRRAQRDFLSRHLARLVRAVHDAMKGRNSRCSRLVADAFDFIESELALAAGAAEAA
uniref:Putative p-cymene dehydrogenase assembly chaperone protein n=2 Tax=Aromatoleum aromaticum TaxID=551760 RepID=A0A096ZNZ8_9RHOO|nr:putative p-cymene dehydrogenase assembly chaperone protein [Aromatoleum aromaticum]